MDGFEDIINEFLVESYESLDRLDDDLMALEDAPEDRERLGSIFRTVHTIKGTSGFLSLPKLERVAHVGENLLVPLRDGALQLNQDMASVLLEMVDAIREILRHIESAGEEGDEDYEELVEKLQSMLTGPSEPATDESPATSEDEVCADVQTVTEELSDTAVDATQSDDSTADSTAAQSGLSETNSDAVHDGQTSPEQTSPEQPSQPAGDIAPPVANDSPPTPKPSSTKPAAAKSANDSGEKQQSLADSTIRIDVDLLDKLMNLVGELVLARNQIIQFCSETDDPAMVTASQRLNLITTELQEGVMKTRMQPIRNAWSKLPRVVRDLSQSCGKQVAVRMEGADTELDKTILEAIRDPLTHVVRNSVDHGIESPEVREAMGKSPEGILRLRAFHEGGQVNIEIIDDGGGIDPERVKAKAIEKGVVSAEDAEMMNDNELTSLILLPGFSTAEKVTNVSGRGVGMDVVKTNIEAIGGTLDIRSEVGKGTTLRIKIPLTLAIVPALIVNAGGDQYAIPQVSLLELVRLRGERAEREIEYVHDTPVYRLREHLLPLVYLDEQLGFHSQRDRCERQESVNIVVLQAEDRQFGLVVDSITDTQEIVVKPLGPHFMGLDTYAGATIMGDGTVSLILDVIGLAQKSGVLNNHADHTHKDHKSQVNLAANDGESMLIVDVGDGTRAAIRLSSVARLEEFSASAVEVSGHSRVVQYRDRILPLVPLNGATCIGYGGEDASDRMQTVVYNDGELFAGVVVSEIVDIVHRRNSDDNAETKRAVIQDRVTQFIDIREVVATEMPQY